MTEICNPPKIIMLLGATASGKTSLAIQLARRFNGEIISADSRQVYIGMDIGTGKEGEPAKIDLPGHGLEPARIIDGIPQYLIDLLSPKENYTVANFQKSADQLIKVINTRAKIPFVVGGTNLYIQALAEGYQLPVADKKEREIRFALETLSSDQIIEKLKKTDPEYLAQADLKNTRRLIRALSVTLATGQKFSSLRKKSAPKYDILYLGLDLDRRQLYRNIDKRVDDRIKLGMIEEVQSLLNQGIPSERLIAFGLEYRFITQYLIGEISDKDEMVQRLKFAIHAYARRQLIWLRNKMPVVWINNFQQAKNQVEQFLAK